MSRVFDAPKAGPGSRPSATAMSAMSPTPRSASARSAPTHVVAAPRTFLYPGPDLGCRGRGELSLGSRVTVTARAETRGTRYALLASGEAVIAEHLAPVGEDRRRLCRGRRDAAPHALSVGRRSAASASIAPAWCSLPCAWPASRAARFRHAGRDLGDRSIPARIFGLRRGDLVFWKGHVAIMTDPDTMIHANGHTMTGRRARG